ncbi:hypothetical protein [Amphritea balenae]|uniref:Uncharacterized protein n=1 Tax=Amphritea balenae TaxID=452629 RepID=A0A3P1SKV1_9GAMM|nr:hypothetical protein [Amphritea balenae]RRC97726.1 hypothetical protein EHS89_16220 [Amphritea balenae]
MQHQQSYSLVSAEHAELLIVDMEHPSVGPVVERYQNSRPIVAVTATEQSFEGFVTLRKPLEGKRLITAIDQAIAAFIPTSQSDSDNARAVSSDGERAFQDYQKRLAAGRQAISDYKSTNSDRAQKSDQVRQRFILDDKPEDEKKASAPRIKATVKAQRRPVHKTVEVSSDTPAVASVKVKAKSVPVEHKVPEKKPAEVRAKLSYQMVYECCGNAPDVNMYEPDQRRRVFFKDDSTLLAILQEVIAEGESQNIPVEITGLPGTLAYLPAQKAFLFDFSEDLLVPLALTRFGYQELTLKVRPDLDVDRPSIGSAKVVIEASDKLMWKLALWTAKGRLNKTLDPEAPLRLARQLDFNRLLAIPHATTINSLWGRHSLSALEVVKVLKINQRYVFSFMTAANALGAFK